MRFLNLGFRRTQQCGNYREGRLRTREDVFSFRRTQQCGNRVEVFGYVSDASAFQKNLVVWKPQTFDKWAVIGEKVSEELSSVETLLCLFLFLCLFLVSEELSSVETLFISNSFNCILESFRRTQQCGNNPCRCFSNSIQRVSEELSSVETCTIDEYEKNKDKVSEELSSVETSCNKLLFHSTLVRFRRTQQCGNWNEEKYYLEKFEFQKNLVVWKLFSAFSVSYNNPFVSEELSSVETEIWMPQSFSTTAFQKNLVVWKLIRSIIYFTFYSCFRRTQQCGNGLTVPGILFKRRSFRRTQQCGNFLLYTRFTSSRYCFRRTQQCGNTEARQEHEKIKEFQKNLVVWKPYSR